MPVRLLTLVPYPRDRAPGQRYRIEQWEPVLRAEGIHLSYAPFLSDAGMDVLFRRGRGLTKTVEMARSLMRRARELRHIDAYDAAFVYREAIPLVPPVFERHVARRIPVVYDFDDAIYLPSASAANRWTRHLKGPRKPAALCRLAAHVTVGNEHLAQFARRHAPAVSVLPTTIDTDLYAAHAVAPRSLPVVGWTGSTTTLPYLLALAEPLRALRARHPFELRVIAGERVAVPGLSVDSRIWQSAAEVADLCGIDVGLMPLPDDPWTRGKCGLKALQYMALGIPPVVSPIGVNATLVDDGVDGLHASTPGEWVSAIERLLLDPDLRARLGREAREKVLRQFSARVLAPRLADILRGLASRS